MSTAPLQPGDRARKIGGSYQAIGTIVATFTTITGHTRHVFEFDAPAGMLHIFGPEQVQSLDDVPVDPPTLGRVAKALREILDMARASNNRELIEPALYALQQSAYINLEMQTEQNEQARRYRTYIMDALSTAMWLYRRLPREYGRPNHIENGILMLARQINADVSADLAERDAPDPQA